MIHRNMVSVAYLLVPPLSADTIIVLITGLPHKIEHNWSLNEQVTSLL